MDWCSPCASCPGTHRAIGGNGPRPAPILVIAERPGQDEIRNGRILCSNSGQEFDELYLSLAGLHRQEIRCCNTVLCGAVNSQTPTAKEALACARYHIPGEIEKTNPRLIILMGATACSLLHGGTGIRLDYMHGIPQHTSKVGSLFGWQGTVLPMYHPAMGLHESRWMQMMMEDWRALAYINTDTDADADVADADAGIGVVDYRLVKGREVNDLLQSQSRPAAGAAVVDVAVDTESHGPFLYSVQCSFHAGTGFLVLASDRLGLGVLRDWFASQKTRTTIMHHAGHDLAELSGAGLSVQRVRDTMQEAHHLGNLPQGLKDLTYRLFRHTMTSYEEVVWPASIRALQDWMLEAVQIAEADLSYTERVQLKTKVKEKVSKGELEKLLLRLMQNSDSGSEYNPWREKGSKRLDDFWADPCQEPAVSHIESRIGHYPILGIANCSEAEAVRYAVGDADWTGRVAVELEKRRRESFQISATDRDI